MFLPKNHDLSLPNWGPYSKRYAGISHVAEAHHGLRFDFSVFPGLYRRRLDVPSATWESGWHPWECAPNFESVTFRHELIWKDQLYLDVTYVQLLNGEGALVRCEFVNAMDRPVPVSLHAVATMQFPSVDNFTQRPMRRIETQGDWLNKAVLKHPIDYEAVEFAVRLPGDALVADGLLRGEIRRQDVLDGSALGGRFGGDAGDRVRYQFRLERGLRRAVLVIRLQGRGSVKVRGFCEATLGFDDVEAVNHSLSVGDLAAGIHELEIETTSSCAGLEVHALAIHSADDGELKFEVKEWDPVPERISVASNRRRSQSGAELILKYPDAPSHYGIAWDYPGFVVREILHDELDSFLRYKTHDHVEETLRGNGLGHFLNVHMRPLPLAPKSRSTVWGVVCSGSLASVRQTLEEFSGEGGTYAGDRREFLHESRRPKVFAFQPNPGGAAFTFSQNRMVATTLSNAVYPVYTQRQQIRHRPPGRWWNSLYTWDSGFIGLGLLEISPHQAKENLDQYLTEAGNPHAAFIQHGSMVPMQIHLYHEIWNRTNDLVALAARYASVRQYYLFYAGIAAGSTTGDLASNLLRPWDYFYNSGGWDDYPAQKHVHVQGLEATVTPVITTALAIRCAKTLILAAGAVGHEADIAGYEADIVRFSQALEQHSWDAEAGCYSYVVHDEAGQPSHLLRDAGGANLNLGLDGLFPLVAGICDADRVDQLLGWLFDPSRLWSKIGLSAVDASAPYYRVDGYWSGTVWFPHQWFFWKTMLDLGRPELALAIAQRALETWRAEVDETYNCFEHFLIETGRGCGWHQFSGLSTPVMIFFAACYCPGTFTVGFDAWVVTSHFEESNRTFSAEVSVPAGSTSRRRSFLVCLEAGPKYETQCDGLDASVQELLPGLIAVTFSPPTNFGVVSCAVRALPAITDLSDA